MSEPKYCVNCVHYRAVWMCCARNEKGAVSRVTGRYAEGIGLDCEMERRAGMPGVPAFCEHLPMPADLRRMVCGGDCGPEAKFFQPKVKR